LYDEAVRRQKQAEQQAETIKSMQQELIRREKLAVVAKLVGDIAHEIQNPLLPIRLNNQRLREDTYIKFMNPYEKVKSTLDETTNEEFKDAFRELYESSEAIETNVNHIFIVIDNLRKTADGDVDTIGPIDFKSQFKEMRALLEANIPEEEEGAEIVADIERNLPYVRGNAAQLQQVILNLYKNARFAMNGQQKKRFTVTAKVDDDKNFVRLEFSDTGKGIPPDILNKLFTRGFTTKGDKGTGAGLYQSKIIVEHFGGTISVKSEPGKGATFIIRLPIMSEKGTYERK